MPNTQVWGLPEGVEDQYADQDLVSLGNEIIEVADIEDAARTALKATNSDGDGKALEVVGKAEFHNEIIVGDGDNDGEIDSTGDEDLKIGTGSGTNNVVIGRETQVASIKSKIRVGEMPQAPALPGKSPFNSPFSKRGVPISA